MECTTARVSKVKNLKADGHDQPVTGQNYDTLAVQVVDANSIHARQETR